MNLYNLLKKHDPLRKKTASFLLLFFSSLLLNLQASLAVQLPYNLSGYFNKPEILEGNHSGQVLIAASPQLNDILYNYTVQSPTSTQVRHYSIRAYGYSDAYSTAWYVFNLIVVPSSVQFATYTPTAGHIYTGILIGGGTANIRERGTSGPFPTLDILQHNTPPHPSTRVNMAQVREIKFMY
jgi:hypothetical protein